jgi:hypothetical protein
VLIVPFLLLLSFRFSLPPFTSDSPGKYEVVLKHGGGLQTVAEWDVVPLAKSRKAKNGSSSFLPILPFSLLSFRLFVVILFVGDGMAPSMVTAARMLGHKSVNGKYQSTLTLDKSESLGLQMSASISPSPSLPTSSSPFPLCLPFLSWSRRHNQLSSSREQETYLFFSSFLLSLPSVQLTRSTLTSPTPPTRPRR